ncbi:SdpI family protein [Mucilaginibacter terrae]|uniref:Membrane protein n=1 Tax=Mucilaginibacter terrae TaxID=1955052 RepID=A0ABU3GRW7_9SPHI|nr:SdpI family protein [Mucilaginibacter terrae]MDT3402529.1 putative membrane protein [Mucilaginibacter terrae]
MKKFSWYDVAAFAIWLMPIVYLINIYPALPAKVALHFGLDGKPDRYGDSNELLVPVGIMAVTSLGTYLLINFLPRIDPKQKAKYSADTFQKMALGLVVFLSAINVVIIAAAEGDLQIEKILFPMLGLFFAFLGNIMHSLKPNYFAGIRTHWTLESEETWTATHRLAGKVWFAGGLIITVVTLLLTARAANIVFLSLTGVMVVVPMVFSYIYFKNHRIKTK